ncbi:hypothetical protein B0J11DRAFT_31666 [Dendryphion nanum]|uniref:Uncharacterized protein n=1 Tax=Dendryphion nanum TaxID=256645 RepID=A0A9P9IX63_9PLEO|nr:hypothetical protein B0J11DRAFT_31666 [Dendryphion nanum]
MCWTGVVQLHFFLAVVLFTAIHQLSLRWRISASVPCPDIWTRIFAVLLPAIVLIRSGIYYSHVFVPVLFN